MSKDVYQRNLQALNRRSPELAALVFTGEEDEETVLQQTAEGYPTLGVKRDGEYYFLHHPEQPLADAKRIIADSDGVNDHWCFIHLGMGLGYAALLLASREPDPPACQIIIERSLSVFRRACQTVDLTILIGHPYTFFAIGNDPAGTYQACLTNLMDLMANAPKLVKSPPSLNLDGPFYEACVSRIQEALRFGQSGLLSKQQDGRVYLGNLIRNLEPVAEAPGLKPMQSQLRDIPAVVVAAGPSLSKNIHLLRGTERQWLIVAVDTALEKCLRNDITPHFVCTVDPTELNLKHFPRDEYPEDIRLLYDPEAVPDVVRRFGERGVTYNTLKHPFHNWLESDLGPKGQIEKGAMVSEAAFYACRYLGCRPIILMGQDLALDPNTGATHDKEAALVLHAEYIEDDRDHAILPSLKSEDRKFRERIFWVDGIDGEPVPTVQNLEAYLRLLERDVAQTHVEVIDATEGGARIAGTTVRKFADVVAEFAGDRFDVDAFMEAIRKGTPKKDRKNARDFVETLRRRLRQARRVAKKGLEMVSPWVGAEPPDRDPVQLQSELDPLRQQIYADPINEYLIEQTAAATLFNFLQLGPACVRDNRARCAEVIRRYRAAFEATVEACDHLQPILEAAEQDLRFKT